MEDRTSRRPRIAPTSVLGQFLMGRGPQLVGGSWSAPAASGWGRSRTGAGLIQAPPQHQPAPVAAQAGWCCSPESAAECRRRHAPPAGCFASEVQASPALAAAAGHRSAARAGAIPTWRQPWLAGSGPERRPGRLDRPRRRPGRLAGPSLPRAKRAAHNQLRQLGQQRIRAWFGPVRAAFLPRL
jgi:hypothetical protein